ncbi:MAG: hypothetical protein OXG09_06215 [Chloroflexi bacterium]|nr:hypothetical protein [Chloroflexota bacterium]
MLVNKIIAALLVMFVFVGIASAQVDCENFYFGSDVVDGVDLRFQLDHITFGIAETADSDDIWTSADRMLTGTFDLPSLGNYSVLFSNFGRGTVGWTSIEFEVLEADCEPFFKSEELIGFIFTTCPAKVSFIANTDAEFLFWLVINFGGERYLQCRYRDSEGA